MRGTWCWLGFALGVGAAHAQEVRSLSVDEALRQAAEAAAANRARAARELQVARVRLALLPLLPFEGISGTGSFF